LVGVGVLLGWGHPHGFVQVSLGVGVLVGVIVGVDVVVGVGVGILHGSTVKVGVAVGVTDGVCVLVIVGVGVGVGVGLTTCIIFGQSVLQFASVPKTKIVYVPYISLGGFNNDESNKYGKRWLPKLITTLSLSGLNKMVAIWPLNVILLINMVWLIFVYI